MMALRRYLTTQYDWTGISRLLYSSAAWEFGALALVAAFVALLFSLPRNFGFGLLHHSTPQALSTVMLDKFAPSAMVHKGDIALAALLGFLLLSNALRMFRYVTQGRQIPLRIYFAELRQLIIQGLFQLRWKACGDGRAIKNWLRHFVLVTGYVTMFSLVVLFLPWFQVENSSFQWTSYLGYYATAALLITTLWIIADRIGKKSEMHRFSHLSDWLFPILLLLTALSGILVNVFRIANLPMATYVTYEVHLMIAVPMLAVEVPFGKWAHLIYRPLAIYLAGAIQKAQTAAPAGVVLSREIEPGNREYYRPELIIF
jgi:nitrate reductase gamma subunit